MQQCKEEKNQPCRFIRDVKAAPEPAMVLATDIQIFDMVSHKKVNFALPQ